jgi:succinate dehydrogenase/fumarate reductase flavoprotein subunit
MQNEPTIEEQATALSQLTEGNFSAISNPQELETALATFVNQLMQKDFEKLLFVLYRIDVDEQQLKRRLVEQADTDAGLVIARLIIARQLEKIKSRRQHRRDDNNISEEEKW